MSDEKPDLNALLEHYGSKTRERGRYMTSCPLHDDRTPSLSVDSDKGLWNCHSCGEAGDSYSLLMKKEEVNFTGARALAASFGLSTGGAGGGGEQVSGSRYGARRKVPGGKGRRSGGSSYTPAWRRR